MNAKLQLSAEEMRLVTDPGWILTKNSVIGKTVELMARLSEEYVDIWGRGFRGGGGASGGAGIAGEGGADGSGDAAFAGGVAGNAGGTDAGGTGGGETAGILRGFETGSPKISRGENYRGLPWVMLDYPRAFGREDVLAIRTMFWWGHGSNVTLHLKGRWMDLCLPVISRRRGELAAAGFHIGINEDEWRLEHGPENYRAFAEGDARAEGNAAVLGDARAGEDAVKGADVRDEVNTLSEMEALTGGRAFLKLSAAVGLDRWAEAPTLMKTLFGVLVNVLGDAHHKPAKGA